MTLEEKQALKPNHGCLQNVVQPPNVVEIRVSRGCSTSEDNGQLYLGIVTGDKGDEGVELPL